MPLIQLETKINAPMERCFDLSRSIDLHKISTSHTSEEAIAGITSGLIGPGEFVTWRARHFGVFQKLTTQITAFKNPEFFVDEMIHGIFKSLRHEHIFVIENNQTIMIDKFYYQSPMGILGRIADKLFLKSYLKKLLVFRNNTIKTFAESEEWKKIL